MKNQNLKISLKNKKVNPKKLRKKFINFLIEKHQAYCEPQFRGPRSRPGVPDYICCIKGQFVGIEFKRPKEIVSDAQKINIINIRNCGGIAFVFRDFDKSVEFLKLKGVIK